MTRTTSADLVELASAMLPLRLQARYREQWHADLAGASAIQVRPSEIVRSAFFFALAVAGRDLRRTVLAGTMTRTRTFLIALVIFVPVITGFARVWNSATRDHLEVYSLMLNSPLTLAFYPLFVGLIAGVSIRWTSKGRRATVANPFAQILGSAIVTFLVFFGFAFVPFITAFYVWPIIGDPTIDPSLYGDDLSPLLRAAPYSALLASGPLPFGIVYSLVVGFASAVIGALGLAVSAIVRSRVVGFLIVTIFMFVVNTAAWQIRRPDLGPLTSTFPFGVSWDESPAVGPVTVAVLGLSTLAVWAMLLPRIAKRWEGSHASEALARK